MEKRKVVEEKTNNLLGEFRCSTGCMTAEGEHTAIVQMLYTL